MGLESQNLKELTGYIEEAFSEYMTFPTVLFIVAIVVALSSIACFILAPFYIKGKARGAKTAAQVISVIDFIIGILLILAFLIITLLFNMASDGFFDSADEFMNAVLGFLIVPTRFGMSLEAVFGADANIGTPILFYALYFVTAGLLGLAAFIVSCIARGKYNAANGLIRCAAAPVGVPQYNPYQPYGQPNIQQGYPQQYGQNAQQGYPQQYGQNVQQGYPQQYGQNIPQGYPQQYGQNIPQGYPQQYQQNIRRTTHSISLLSRKSAKHTAGQRTVSACPAGNFAGYTAGQRTVSACSAGSTSEYTAGQRTVSACSAGSPQNIPQDNAQYQPVSHPAQQEDANTEVPVQAAVAQEAPVQQASPSFCGNCGTPVTPGASFCQNCGNKIN
ncbi:MAG: zinc ribbon domain-containing protein [[Eubacterium] siraeum]